MDKSTLMFLLRSMQVEIILLLALVIGFRKRLRTPWVLRTIFALLAVIFVTLAATVFFSYNNGMVSSAPSHSNTVVPFWLVSLLLAFVWFKRFIDVGKFRNEERFSQSKSYQYLYSQTRITAILIPVIPLGVYVPIIQPYFNWVLVPLFFILWGSNIVGEYFVVTKKKVALDSNN